jgi:1,4-dihydroxy-6-naphthoate synthase
VGAALGFGNGPLVVSKRKIYPDEIPHIHLAIPGKYTTAALMSGVLLGKTAKTTEYLFSNIPQVVMDGECDAGLLIHETRFTYEKMGLKKVCDLGEMWEKETGLPLPLGCFVVRKGLPDSVKADIADDLRQSLVFAKNNSHEVRPYIMQHAKEMDWKVAQKHIDLFVNEFTENLGEQGKKAIEEVLLRVEQKGLIENPK